MSKSPLLDPDGSIDDLSDRELLERLAVLDPNKYPIARHAQCALENLDDQAAQEDSS